MDRHPAKLEDLTRLLGQGKVNEALALFEEIATFKPRPMLQPGDLVQLRETGPWYEVATWNGADIYHTRSTVPGCSPGDTVKRSLSATLRINRQGFIWTRRT